MTILRMRPLLAIALLLASGLGRAADFDAGLTALQHGWATAYYGAPEAQKKPAFEKLLADADRLLARYPRQADVLTWHAIVLSSAAKFSSGLHALGQAKQARDELLEAEQIDATTLGGSVYTSLGSLYANVPGWPIGFGSKDKAEVFLQKALAINPAGIDPNFFYAELLAARGDKAAARHYYEAALAAAPRPGREDADAGRRAEINAGLRKLGG